MKVSHGFWMVAVLMIAGLLGSLSIAQDEAPVPEFQPFDKVVGTPDEVTTLSGLFPVYQTKNGLYAEMPVGQEFYLATSISSGPYRGFQTDDYLLRWDRVDKQLVLVEPNYRLIVSKGGTMQETVNATYPDTVLSVVPIVCMGPGGGPVIDMKSLLVGQSNLFVQGIGSGDSRLSKASKVKTFPGNVEIEMNLVRIGRNGNNSIHYSFSILPQTDYQPRTADPRIGYFLTALQDFSADEKQVSNFVRYINRWDVRKEDPEAESSPAKNPIVFYIEKSVPIQYRKYVREGILEWNNAYETVGLIDAVVVRQQTATNEFKDLDPEDVRYNFFRWITSGSAFAMGPSRVNPRTGQILDADIIFDNSMVTSYLKSHDFMIAEAAYGAQPPFIKDFIRENPQFDPADFMKGRLPEKQKEVLAQALQDPWSKFGDSPERMHTMCQYGIGKAQQMGLAAMQFGLWSKKEGEGDGDGDGNAESDYPEEFIGEVIKDIVMHEVGHTLGLRHNFKASSWRTIKEVADEKVSDITASVMDYTPINIQSKAYGKQGSWTHTGLGPYDFWAIEYGYTLDGSNDNLKAITSRSAEPQLTYATDEDTWSTDPLIGRWDLGADPMTFAKDRMVLVSELTDTLVERTVPDGESYSRVRNGFSRLLSEFWRSASIVDRFVGGQYLTRDHRGTPNERPPASPVEATRQREALQFLCDNVFSKEALNFDPELLQKLVPSRWMHWGSNDWYASTEYPIHDMILLVQSYILFDLLNPWTMSNIYDNEMKVEEDTDALTLPELVETLTGSICKEILSTVPKNKTWTNRKPLISSTRRNLQRQYITFLINISLEGRRGSYPQAARTLAWHELKNLHESISTLTGGSSKNLDRYSVSHLEECKELISKALEANFSLR